ncbi:MAG: FkbM family methyltransferase [Planctomycetia bacterium]|nr:FkbM family methyltransferase [Planctomycetia bacterium]
MNNLLIAVLSCQAYPQRRERCLATWIPKARELGIDVVFVVGSPSQTRAVRDGDLLIVPAGDDYASLPQKVAELCRWALAETDCDYLFKCDDDTYVRPERLLAVDVEGADYIGAEWAPGAGYASGGAGYLLSRRAIETVSATMLQFVNDPTPTDAEDVLVGRCLFRSNLPLRIDGRFLPYGNDELRPRPGNHYVTAHACQWPWLGHHVDFEGRSPVVTCRPLGGLCNVMFQAAAAAAFAQRHGTHHAVFDSASFGRHRNTVFRSLTYGRIPGEVLSVDDPEDFSFRSIPNNPSYSVAVCGHVQSEKYFDDCGELIRNLFQPAPAERRQLGRKYGALLGRNTVSLHVRRGDYVGKQNYHPLLPLDYYDQALRHIKGLDSIENVLCFSDDLPWCREHLRLDRPVHVIDGEPDHLDLALMSMCRHHIIANSTFSWWGAWLNPDPTKIVVAPRRWFGPAYGSLSDRDLVPAAWTRIGWPDQESIRAPCGLRTGSRRIAEAPRFSHGLTAAEMRALVGRDDPLVFELGCNDGIDSANFLREFPGITLHCFEPDRRPLARFRERISDPRCTLHEFAIGAADGEVEFHLSGGNPPDGRMNDWDLSSSLRRPTGHLAAHPWCTFDRKMTVQTRSLDSWLAGRPEITVVDFIWADIQGAECDLIAGGAAALQERTRYLYTEFYEQPMYDGQIAGQEILDRLPAFECIGVYEGYNMLLRNRQLSSQD